MIVVQILWFALGILIVGYAVQSAIRTFMLPQPGETLVSRIVFRTMRGVVAVIDRPGLPRQRRQEWLSVYAPLCLLLIVVFSIALIGLGYTLILYGLGVPSLEAAFVASLSSVSTLGFATLGDELEIILVATIEAMTGILIVGLLVGYLPTVYAGFQQREQAIDALETHVGSPDSAVAILGQYARSPGLDHLGELWDEWTTWFVSLRSSQSSLAGILFVRTPRPHRSWVTAAGAVLDAAALAISALDRPADPRAERCIEAGGAALRQAVGTLRLIPRLARPSGEETLSVSRAAFDTVCESLAAAGLVLKPDREAAWLDFARRRRQYDATLIELCRMTLAREMPWPIDPVKTRESPDVTSG